jgi:hypothetical protein
MRGRNPRPAADAAIVLAGAICVLLTGCQLGGLHAPAELPVPQGSSAKLVMYISAQPFVTAEPGYRAVYVLAKSAEFSGEFPELTATLQKDGLIGKGWDYAADRCLDRASVGFMVCRACRIRSGLNWTLTGLGRYAWRELQYQGIAGQGSETATMSGGEFVGVLLRAEDYLVRTGKGETPKTELGRPGS